MNAITTLAKNLCEIEFKKKLKGFQNPNRDELIDVLQQISEVSKSISQKIELMQILNNLEDEGEK